MEICSKTKCTGCGACAYTCPKQCINMKENEIGCIYPIVETEKCIRCNRCKSVCPVNKPPEFRQPTAAYASWSTDEDERRNSASGGVAAELYHLALNEGRIIIGAVSNSDFSVSHIIGYNESDIKGMKNSKYVFSTAYDLFPKLKNELSSGKTAVIIGLPCQIAAIQNLFSKYREQLLLVDVVCHGTTPFSYLRQHINMIENRCGKKAVTMSFRDPKSYTYTFTFSLYDKDGKRIYAQRTKDGDTYQFGYHKMISYRENCYHCQYACGNRISDITLSDYKGLGRLAPCSFNEQKVSCVLVHTQKGRVWVDKLISEGKIFAEQRPVQEPIQGDPQLQHPSVKSKSRINFENNIRRTNGDFEKTMDTVIRCENIRTRIKKPLNIVRKLKRKIIGDR